MSTVVHFERPAASKVDQDVIIAVRAVRQSTKLVFANLLGLIEVLEGQVEALELRIQSLDDQRTGASLSEQCRQMRRTLAEVRGLLAAGEWDCDQAPPAPDA